VDYGKATPHEEREEGGPHPKRRTFSTFEEPGRRFIAGSEDFSSILGTEDSEEGGGRGEQNRKEEGPRCRSSGSGSTKAHQHRNNFSGTRSSVGKGKKRFKVY